jgi:hypothetical protein
LLGIYILRILKRVKEIAHSHLPVDNGASRSGNPAFREFYDHLDDQVSPRFFKTTHNFENVSRKVLIKILLVLTSVQESEELHGSLDVPEEKRVLELST